MKRLLRFLGEKIRANRPAQFSNRNFGFTPDSPHARRPRVRVRIQIGGVETTQ